MVFVSECKSCMEDEGWQPVMQRKAEFGFFVWGRNTDGKQAGERSLGKAE